MEVTLGNGCFAWVRERRVAYRAYTLQSRRVGAGAGGARNLHPSTDGVERIRGCVCDGNTRPNDGALREANAHGASKGRQGWNEAQQLRCSAQYAMQT